MGEQFRGQTDAKLLKLLREFPRYADPALREVLGAHFQRSHQAMRRLEEDGGLGARRSGQKIPFPTAAFGRKKTAEVERFTWKSRADERREDGAGAGNDGVGQLAFPAGAKEAMTGIGNAGKSGIRDEGDVLPRLELCDQFFGPARFVVLVVTDQRL